MTSTADIELLSASSALRAGDYPLGAELANHALERYQETGDREGRMRSLNLLGVGAFEQGRLAEAHAAFAEALDLARSLGDQLMMARTTNNLASVTHLAGEVELALGYYRSALCEYEALKDERGIAQTWHNLALVHRQLGDLPAAEECGTQAVAVAEQVGDRELLALTVTGLAETFIESGKPMCAARALERARAYASNDELALTEITRLEALAAYRQGDAVAAWVQAEDARLEAARHGNALLEHECMALTALALRALGQPAEAQDRATRTMAGFSRMRAAYPLERFRIAWFAESS